MMIDRNPKPGGRSDKNVSPAPSFIDANQIIRQIKAQQILKIIIPIAVSIGIMVPPIFTITVTIYTVNRLAILIF